MNMSFFQEITIEKESELREMIANTPKVVEEGYIVFKTRISN
jgi:RecB family endonuclease NucS